METILQMKNKIRHEIVKSFPDNLEGNVLYISLEYASMAHKCFCGCGEEVTTPLSPTDWKVLFDGVNVSVYPSIGNWNLKCKSHYWIKENKISWSTKWDKERIKSAQDLDREIKDDYYQSNESLSGEREITNNCISENVKSLIKKFKK